MKRLLLIIALFLLPNLATAQTWPDRTNTYINDIAGIIETGTKTRLLADLELLREETGVELTVLTIATRAEYQSADSTDSVAEFATKLFNEWGVGDSEKNNGILVLLVSEDHDLRLELGSGYGEAYNALSRAIVDRIFVPALKSGDFSTAISAGTGAINQGIARPHTAGETAAKPETVAPEAPSPVAEPTAAAPASESDAPESKKSLYIFGGGFLALIMAIIFGKRVKDRMSTCPSCGKRGMHTERKVLEAATETEKGSGEETVTCSNCDHNVTTPYTIALVTKPKEGESTGKGGATGKW